ncbi:MAG: response regulator transcription factor [Bacillota bacterium]|nr:response regulator transcription factor [Bacillota bacterium]
MTTILLVDDDESILRVVSKYFEKAGIRTLEASCGRDALSLMRQASVDLVVLDIMLPDSDGLELCERIRREGATPVIMLTARGDVDEKINAFRKGADDYVVKPFDPNELVARAQAVLKRVKEAEMLQPELHPGGVREFDELVIDRDRYSVTLGGFLVKLTKKEYMLLDFFASNPNKVLSRSRIVEAVWGVDFEGGERVVDITVDRLRKSLKSEKPQSWRIKSLRGVGYMFEVDK